MDLIKILMKIQAWQATTMQKFPKLVNHPLRILLYIWIRHESTSNNYLEGDNKTQNSFFLVTHELKVIF